MIACLKVTSGSVKLSVKITSPNAKSKLTAAYQSSSHSPLKNTRTIKKGQWIKMTRTGSNLSTLPLIVAAKKGANINRRLNTTSYENYSFKSKYVAFRRYTNKKGGKLYKRKYLNTNGRTKYHFMLIPQSSAGRSYTGVLTTKKGNVTYYYPSDYITVSGYAGNSK